MRTRPAIGFAAALLAMLAGGRCGAAEVAGRIADPSGAPVSGIAVTIKNQAGIESGAATTDANGRYAIRNLAAGTFTLIVNGQTAVAYVDDPGLTVDWGIATGAPAIAIAHRGIGKDSSNDATMIAPLAPK